MSFLNRDVTCKTTNVLNVKMEHLQKPCTIQVSKLLVEKVAMYFVVQNLHSKIYGYIISHLPSEEAKKFIGHITISGGSRVRPKNLTFEYSTYDS